VIGGGVLAERSDGIEVAVLHAALDAERGARADGRVNGSAKELGKRSNRTRIAVLEAGGGGAEPGSVHAAFTRQGLHIEPLAVKGPPVLPAAHDEEGVLRIAEIVPPVHGVVKLDAQVTPFWKGNAGIHTVQRLVETWNSVERVGKPGVSGVNLKWGRLPRRLCRMDGIAGERKKQ